MPGSPGLTLAAVTARDRARGERFLKGLSRTSPFIDLDTLVAVSDLVVEASTQAHLAEIAPRALGAGRHLVVLSCGGLLGRDDWVEPGRGQWGPYLGTLGGHRWSRRGEGRAHRRQSRPSPWKRENHLAGWRARRGSLSRRIDLSAITAETLIFEGSAREACQAFPANVNVVAALSLAGVGPERTRIRSMPFRG